MSPKPTEDLFLSRSEWTKRKHELLSRYVVPAASKMKLLGRRLVLVDGYAGPGRYGDEVEGSTLAMLQAAQKVIDRGVPALVVACEPNASRLRRLRENLRSAIDDGTLVTFGRRHSRALHAVFELIQDDPTLVFLDPQKPKQMRCSTDIEPWLARPKTDVLGIFMANGACRAAAEALHHAPGSISRTTAKGILGDEWQIAVTEQSAIEVFMRRISGRKRFTGIYPMRKLHTRSYAYAFFGASDSEHGIKLLSDAVATDLNLLEGYDADQYRRGRPQDSLFADEEAAELLALQEAHLSRLADIARALVLRDPDVGGKELSLRLFADPDAACLMFGRYKESDFTAAKRLVLLSES